MALKHLKTLNEELPTIEVDADAFQNPYHKDPNFFKKGYKDGAVSDDVVKTRPVQIPANKLKPSQDAVYLGKALGLAISGVVGGDLQAIISSDNRILDGHHRWAATILNNPKAKIGGVQAELKIGDLIQVLRQAGDALGNNRGLEPKGGDINIFKASIKDVEECIFTGKNMNPEFYNREEAINWFNNIGTDNIQKALNQIQRISPPTSAPPREDMPKIKPGQVDNVAKKLAGGALDVRAPYTAEAKKPGPDGYMTGLSDKDEEDKKKQMKKQAAMDDDDPDAYKEMPGDKKARKEGRVKKSKHTTAYHKKFKKNEMKNLQELEAFIDNMRAEKEAQRIEDIKNTKLNTRLKTIDEFLGEDLINETTTAKLTNIARKANGFDDFLKKVQKSLSGFEDISKALRTSLEALFNAANEAAQIDFAFDIFEGVMSDLHIIADEAKDEDAFVKTFFSDYGDKIKKSKDSEEWVRSLYKDTVQESLNEISNKNAEKYSQPLRKLKNPKKIRNIAAGTSKYNDMLVWLSHNAKNLDYHLDGQGQLHVNGEDYEMVRTELNEKNKGLWHNIRAKRKRGEAPARKGSKAYKKAKAAADAINNEAYIGPFVFNDKMSDEELKDMYDAALDGYANYSKGFQHPKSKYKQAYQEIEKILKKRGVSVNEGTLYGNEVAIYMGEDGETRIEKRGRGYYGYNNEFDFTAKNKRELEQKLRGWGYYLIAGSLDEAVELVHVYKDGELYGTGELVKGKDKKIKGKKHQLIRFDGSTEDYYPAEDVKLVESINEDYEKHLDRTYGRNRDYSTITIQDLHFQTDTEELEKMKLAYGYRMGGITSREKIEDADYALRRFRKDIKYGDGKEVGVFLPGSYAAATSKLGDGPHKKATPKVKWNQRKYDQWIEDVASNDGWKHAYDMAQNAKNAPGLIDWVKRNNRGEDPLQVIQWDIEAMAESVSEGARLDVSRYKRVWGKEPKGFGQWLFSFDPKGDQDNVFDVGNAMNYSEAKKLALRVADKNGERTVYLMESIKRNTKYTKTLTKIFRKEFEDFPFEYYQDGPKIVISAEGYNSDGTLFNMKDDWKEDIIRAVRKHKPKWHTSPNMGGGITIHVDASIDPIDEAKLKLSGPILDWWNEADVQRDLKKIKFKIIGDFGGVMTVSGEEKELDKIKKLFGIDEAKHSVIHKAAKKGNYPVTVIATRDGKVVRQETVDTPTQVPAVFNVVQFEERGQGGDVKVHIESRTGETLFTESVNEGKMPDRYVGLDDIVYVKVKEDSRGANYRLYWRGHDVEVGGRRFGSEKELKAFANDYILSNQVYNKLKYKKPQAIPEKKQTNMEKLQTLESFVTEKKKQTNDQSPLSDDGMETGIKNKAKESGVPVGLLRIIMRRGLAAWKTGHRPGATQAQWGYARVNSFLTKQDGTWGGADADIAKKVRDGGHDKKL